MSITKILGDKDLSNTEKLDQVADIVATTRKAYGNTDAEIKEVKVNTSHGLLPFKHLEDDSKVSLLMNEALNIKARAIAAVEDDSGKVLGRVVEELLATNSMFANVSTGSDFGCL